MRLRRHARDAVLTVGAVAAFVAVWYVGGVLVHGLWRVAEMGWNAG